MAVTAKTGARKAAMTAKLEELGSFMVIISWMI